MSRYPTERPGMWFTIWWLTVCTISHAAFAVGNIKVGDPMPVFSLPRVDGTAGSYTPQELKGQPAVVLFWRPNQSFSEAALRDLQEIVRNIGPSKVHAAAVDTSLTPAAELQAVLASKTYSFPLLGDPARDLYGKVGITASPTTLLFDTKGMLQFVVAGHPRPFSQVVSTRLRYLLGEINEEQMSKEIQPTVLKIDHDLAAAWRMYNLGKRLQDEGKSQDAMTMFEKAVSQHPTLSEPRCALGFMKLSAGDVDAAAQLFETALAYQPASLDARLGQAAVLARTGQSVQAEQILLSLLGQSSIAVRTRYELGCVYQARGELEKALTYFQDALRITLHEGRFEAEGTTALPVSPTGSLPPTPQAKIPAVAIAPPPSTPANTVPAAGAPTPATELPAVPNTTPAILLVEPVKPPANAEYIGITRCKKCHLQQWKSWQGTKMAKAFDLLKPAIRGDVKAVRGLEANRDYTKEKQCLACHTNGYGHPGGYQVPAPGDERAARAAEGNAGIGCESCHGPGSRYVAIHTDLDGKRRSYTQAELYAAGQYEVNARVCAGCHQGNRPCLAPGYVFDFEKRKAQGTHQHYELKLRAK